MKIKLGYIALFFIMGACKAPEKESISFEDIAPTSDYEITEDTLPEEDGNLFEVELMRFKAEGISVDSIIETSKKGFPDRFGAIATEKKVLFFEGSETKFFRWVYADSSKTINAFYNWMDCFGENCASIFIGEEKRFQKNALQLYVNDTSIIYVESQENLSTSNWRNYLENDGYEKDWNYFVRQSRGGRAKWFTFVEEIETPLEQ